MQSEKDGKKKIILELDYWDIEQLEKNETAIKIWIEEKLKKNKDNNQKPNEINSLRIKLG